MSYDFHLVAATDPGEGAFETVCRLLEDKFTVEDPGGTGAGPLLLMLQGEQLAVVSVPGRIEQDELHRIFGADVAGQLREAAWVSEVNCPKDKDTAEAVRMFLMLAVAGTLGVVIDPQSNEILNWPAS